MILEANENVNHTTRPIVTGQSVVALRYKDGVVVATDTLCSYGGMADFKYYFSIKYLDM